MSLSKDLGGVSEIVGALLLVVVVSSAAFGFGVFLQQQQKATQEQKAAELARSLESLEVTGIKPESLDLAMADADCVVNGPADQAWTKLTLTVASRHLRESRLEGIRVNDLQVRFAKVGASTIDFSLSPTDPGHEPLVIGARQSMQIVLENVADDSPGCDPAFSLFDAVSSPPLAKTDALRIQLLTGLTNSFEQPFIPPAAVASLQGTPGASCCYNLVGTSSTPGTERAYIVRWDWHLRTAGTEGAASCADDASPELSGHQVQLDVSVATPMDYCIRLIVRDNHGLASSTDIRLWVP